MLMIMITCSGPKSIPIHASRTIPVSNLSPPESAVFINDDLQSSKQTMVDVGGQQVPLSAISIGVALLVVSSIIWQTITAFSASIVRLFISAVVIGGVLLLSSGSEKQSKDGIALGSHASDVG